MAGRYGRKIIQSKAPRLYLYYPADSILRRLRRFIEKRGAEGRCTETERGRGATPDSEPSPVTEEPKEALERREANEYLMLAQNLMAKGDYEGSFGESQRVLGLLNDQPPADTAIFNMGLIYAHPKNPKKDNKRAIYFFNRVIKGYPDSPWAEQARIWVGVLDGVEKLKQVDLEIEE